VPGKPDEPVPVLVVDDNEVFRRALCDLVEAVEGFPLVGEAGSGQEALDSADALAPRLVLMDKRMPGMDGVETTRRLMARRPGTVVFLVSVETPDPQLMDACGAAAMVRKQELSVRRLRELWDEHGS
jgi:DNA-binding NarL/FixJ family response regulator